MAPTPKPWFRFYTEAVHDRKLRRLKPEARWLFVACLCAARQSPQPGRLMVGESPMGWDDLVDLAAMSLKSVEKGTDELQDAGLLGFEDGVWFVPSWEKRQFESDRSSERVATLRKRRCNGDVTADVTAPETETETELPKSLKTEAVDNCVRCQGRGHFFNAGAGCDAICPCQKSESA